MAHKANLTHFAKLGLSLLLCGLTPLTYADKATNPKPYKAHAESSDVLSTPIGEIRKGIPVGNGRFYPEVGVMAGYDNNMLQSEKNEIESAYAGVTAGGALEYRKNTTLYTALVDLAATHYFDSNDDSYLDATLAGNGQWRTGPKWKAGAGLEYSKGHDARGGSDRTFGKEPDTWNQGTVRGGIRYGAKDAKRQVEANIDYTTKRYDEFTGPIKTEDKDTAGIQVTYFYQYKPKTDLLAELVLRNTDYQEDASAGRDNTTQKLRGGVTWHATKQTTGTIKIGYGAKNVDAEGVEDFSGLDVAGEVAWTPTGRDRLLFFTRHSAEDTTGYGVYTEDQLYGVAWGHYWKPRLKSRLELNYLSTDYKGVKREDDYLYGDLKVSYILSKFLDIGGQVLFSSRDSSMLDSDYDKTIFSVFIKNRY